VPHDAELAKPTRTLFLARLSMLAIAPLDDAAAAKDLIEAAAAPAVKSGEV